MIVIAKRWQRGWFVWGLILMFATSFATGCANESKSLKERTVTTDTDSKAMIAEERVTETSVEHHGIVGSVFHVVGEILAFPFQLIAETFRFIF